MTHAIGSGLAHVVTAGAGLFELVADGIGVGEPKVSGDPGGTYTVRPVGLDAVNEPNVVALSLAAMNDRRLLANDEFGLISHGDQRFTVVLPGVSDLSVPGRGLNAVHRTVRDLDEVAISSARYAGVEHNLYAKMVMAALDQNNVGRGAELLLVGHSFGADTALDLAADPEFVGRYRVIQVVATGYNHGPQLNRTGADVNVLAVRNPNDLVVAAMTLMPTEQTGVFGCQVEPTPPAGTAVVNVDGGWSGIGHSVSHYKKVFLVGGEPNQPDGAAVSAVLGRLDSAGFGLPDQMLAVDVTVPVGPGEHPSGLD
jgi:pimeloyl-ACP methyl ester carboxylesterase